MHLDNVRKLARLHGLQTIDRHAMQLAFCVIILYDFAHLTHTAAHLAMVALTLS
jgi:hypothetical protein